jgi:hypothetical protein
MARASHRGPRRHHAMTGASRSVGKDGQHRPSLSDAGQVVVVIGDVSPHVAQVGVYRSVRVLARFVGLLTVLIGENGHRSAWSAQQQHRSPHARGNVPQDQRSRLGRLSGRAPSNGFAHLSPQARRHLIASVLPQANTISGYLGSTDAVLGRQNVRQQQYLPGIVLKHATATVP